MSAAGTHARALLLSSAGIVVVAGVACQPLPTVEAGECGNRVVEPESGEDCDGTASVFGPNARCGAPSSAAACRLTCSLQGGPDAAECPPGWGCGTDGICRQPTGQFEFDSLPGFTRGVGDLDGDDLSDVVMRGSQGEVQVAFFSEGRNLADLFADPSRRPLANEPRVEPFIGKLSADGIDDIALPLVSDAFEVRVFMGAGDRSPDDPFVELITVPFDGEIDMLEVFNPWGEPEGLCEVGGCRESILLNKRSENQVLYSVLDERELVELFGLAPGLRQQSWVVARWDHTRSCDTLGVSYRHTMTGSPGNTIELYRLCNEGGGFATGNTPVSTLGVSDLSDELSLRIAATADIDGNGFADLLINVTDNDKGTIDEPRGYVAWGTGDGHFNSRADFSGVPDLADRELPLIQWITWVAPEDEFARDHGTWAQAAADINDDGRADFLLAGGIIVLSTDDPSEVCTLGSETLVEGPSAGPEGEPLWGYTCLLITESGLVVGSGAERSDMTRDYWSDDSVARVIDINGDGLLEVAAIDKGQDGGQDIDHSPIDLLDLLWIDPSTKQLVLETLEDVRFEDVGAGDIDGDFVSDLVFDNGKSLQVIRGAPFELARGSRLSPDGFDSLVLFGEGRPSISVGAERDGRLTILRDGEWPALALTGPDVCAQPNDCHVRFASGALDGANGYFAWAASVIQTSEGGGLRILRAPEGEANLGPANDSIGSPLIPLSAFGISTDPIKARILAAELGGEGGTEEAVLVARTEDEVELVVLHPRFEPDPGPDDLCGPSFTVLLDNGVFEDQVVCFTPDEVMTFPGPARSMDPTRSIDPFVEVADADGDGNIDLSWATFENSIVLVHGDGTGILPGTHAELFLPEEDEDEDEEGIGQPGRIDWLRWVELDGDAGAELIIGDFLNSEKVWGLFTNYEQGLVVRGVVELDGTGDRPGFSGDFDGDGVDDIAIGTVMMFGKPINE